MPVSVVTTVAAPFNLASPRSLYSNLAGVVRVTSIDVSFYETDFDVFDNRQPEACVNERLPRSPAMDDLTSGLYVNERLPRSSDMHDLNRYESQTANDVQNGALLSRQPVVLS